MDTTKLSTANTLQGAYAPKTSAPPSPTEPQWGAFRVNLTPGVGSAPPPNRRAKRWSGHRLGEISIAVLTTVLVIVTVVFGVVGTALLIDLLIRVVGDIRTSWGGNGGGPIAALHQEAPPAATGGGQCAPGLVYAPQVGGCVRHVTDVAQVRAVSPDLEDDAMCRGKPPGTRYDKKVGGPDGAPGVAHVVCRRRP